MNIKLVSVTERTREIGLRMAVGARSQHILRQSIVEATVLCLCGGATGIAVDRGASLLVRSILQWPTEASLPAVVAAVAVSATIGVLFVFYPAWKASRLDPIKALRYECRGTSLRSLAHHAAAGTQHRQQSVPGGHLPTITGTPHTPAAPTATDAVWVTSRITDDGSIAGGRSPTRLAAARRPRPRRSSRGPAPERKTPGR